MGGTLSAGCGVMRVSKSVRAVELVGLNREASRAWPVADDGLNASWLASEVEPACRRGIRRAGCRHELQIA